MNTAGTPKKEFLLGVEDFEKVFSFGIDNDLNKLVTVVRIGQSIEVTIQYADGTLIEKVREVFEADGPVTCSETENGIYIISHRSLLADRVRLRRTRFF